ncbi:MAG: Unknown protein [uncultured Sulfurovum sp.]|uniref:Lipoprotein n=1 Tax=uncultured Sulfurovum sp. TaxID=269237 RepID=A0A6S6T120_9BACT|nr:MAG: Unknown protein [uncultured Sulfurovum sp.]
MNRKLLATLTITTLLFTACGGDSKGSSESIDSQIKKRQVIVIVHNTPSNLCTLSNIKAGTEGSSLGTITQVADVIDKDTMVSKFEQTNVDCQKYDRENDYAVCGMFDWEEGTGKSCVIAFDYEK